MTQNQEVEDRKKTKSGNVITIVGISLILLLAVIGLLYFSASVYNWFGLGI